MSQINRKFELHTLGFQNLFVIDRAKLPNDGGHLEHLERMHVQGLFIASHND